MNDINERVSKTIISLLKIDADRVSPAARFVEDLGASSLDVVEIVMALEDQFSIEISDNDAEKMVTVGDVVTYIKLKGPNLHTLHATQR